MRSVEPERQSRRTIGTIKCNRRRLMGVVEKIEICSVSTSQHLSSFQDNDTDADGTASMAGAYMISLSHSLHEAQLYTMYHCQQRDCDRCYTH